ncbi:MAG: hypothetical protein H6510_04465 [Acidobacteria bacterium]|nr:hypothetical protein [Acidobacteriota bacterium]
MDVKEVKGLRSIDKVRGTIDPDGSIDYGNFDSLIKTNEGYELEGDFGAVRIIGGKIDLKIHT